MNTTTILLLGGLAVIAGLFFWKRIQDSRKGDEDFARRNHNKESLGKDESVF